MLTMRYVVRVIATKKKYYIIRANFDKAKAESMLYKVREILQINDKLIEDYGSLFWEDEQTKNKRLRLQKKKKTQNKQSIKEFICTNWVLIQAQSLGTSTRGLNHLYEWVVYRPDLYIGDDLDTNSSVQNSKVIERNYLKIKAEAFWGLASYCQIILLWNIIKEDWLVPRFEKDYKESFAYFRVPTTIHDKNICFINGKVNNNLWTFTWDRFVKTQEESDKLNKKYKEKTNLPFTPFVSLEYLKIKEGSIWFWQNHLLVPYVDGSTIIRESMIKRYEVLPKKDSFSKIVMWIDPAFSEKTTADRIGVGITLHRNINNVLKKYTFWSYWYEWKEKDLTRFVNSIFDLYKRFDIDIINIEWNNWWATIWKELKKKWCRVNIRHTSKDKTTRLIEYQPKIEDWFILFNPQWEKEQILISEMIWFPNVQNDDVLDWVMMSWEETTFSKSIFKKKDEIKKHNKYLSDY